MLRTKLTLSTLAATIVLAGCSTQMTQPTQKDVSATKVEAVKVDPTVLDLGYKNGSSLNMKVAINGEKSPFGIKAINSGVFTPTKSDLVTKPNTKLVIKLHKVANAAAISSPMSRFNMLPSPSITEKVYTGPFAWAVAPGSTTITFRGLQPGQDYLVSARLYDAPVTVTNLNVDVSAGGVVTRAISLPGSNPVVFPSSFAFEVNDLIDLNGVLCRVISKTASDVTVVDVTTNVAPANGTDIPLSSYQRDIVAFGSDGSDVANEGMGSPVNVGGGTVSPGAKNTGGPRQKEEIVAVAPDGLLSLLNEDVTTTNTLDLKIQLRNSVNPEIEGNVSFSDGNPASGSESITP